jgi:SAM-dependent methyltransferase
VERYSVQNKDVIDVGCGKGDFLALLCAVGGNRGTGFDPSYVPGQQEGEGTRDITIVRDFYSPKYSSYKADLITCRHVLEHIQFPGEFVRAIAQSIEGRPETVVFFEVPNVLYTLRDMGIWDIIYEHCSYFSSSSLAHLFTTQGFNVLEETELYDGQYLGIDVMARGSAEKPVGLAGPQQGMGDMVAQFSRKYQEKVAYWEEQFSRIAADRHSVVVWGGGSKGVTFLNAMGWEDVVRHMVDINPRKQGMFVPGMGQEVVAPEALRDLRPDIVVIMNPVYQSEIRNTLSGLGIKARVMVA